MSQEQEPYAGYGSGYTPQHFQPSQPPQQPQQPQPQQQAPQEYYGTPEDPYGAQEDMGTSESESEPVSVSASPYGTFEETPPSSGTQGQPPGAGMYQEQPGAGTYGYNPPPYGYAPPYQSQPNFGYEPPRTKAPLPLGEAIKALPRQYFKVLTKPGSMTFAEELGKASWDIIWFQLIVMAVVTAVLSFFALLIVTAVLAGTSGDQASVAPFSPAIVLGFGFAIILFIVILIPVSFFIGTGISYLIAKAFDGKGTFQEQCYATLLINVPTTVLSAICSMIPFVGSLAGSALGIYSIILQIYALMAVHRVGGGKASLIYFIPWIALVVVYAVLLAVFIFIIALAARGH